MGFSRLFCVAYEVRSTATSAARYRSFTTLGISLIIFCTHLNYVSLQHRCRRRTILQVTYVPSESQPCGNGVSMKHIANQQGMCHLNPATNKHLIVCTRSITFTTPLHQLTYQGLDRRALALDALPLAHSLKVNCYRDLIRLPSLS